MGDTSHADLKDRVVTSAPGQADGEAVPITRGLDLSTNRRRRGARPEGTGARRSPASLTEA